LAWKSPHDNIGARKLMQPHTSDVGRMDVIAHISPVRLDRVFVDIVCPDNRVASREQA
jgi:hypothetical protein